MDNADFKMPKISENPVQELYRTFNKSINNYTLIINLFRFF